MCDHYDGYEDAYERSLEREESSIMGTRYILQLDVQMPKTDPDADVSKVFDLLGDSFNCPHELTILAKEDTEYEIE